MPMMLREPGLSAACEPPEFALLVARRQRLRPMTSMIMSKSQLRSPVLILRVGRLVRTLDVVMPRRSSDGL